MAELVARPPELLADLGGLLARLDRELAGLDEPIGRRRLQWDIGRLGETPSLSAAIHDAAARRRVERMIVRWVESRLRVRATLRRSLIHCDANDHNVLVSSLDPTEVRVSGLIDFGDLVETDLLVEPAVAMAYSGLGTADPWSTALPILAGYQRELPLTEQELELLFPAMCARLALSVCVSARRTAEGRRDNYARVSEAPAWAALEVLDAVDPSAAAADARRIARGAWSEV